MSNRRQPDPLVGRLVDGRYQVRERIAHGGMATVYVATDLRLERRIALKVMHHHLSDDERFQTRFIQEARAAARLNDPHVVGVFDQGQDDDIAYLAMEYLPGITLRELLNQQKHLSLEQTVTIMHAVLQGLSAAHEAGYIHRDVKPENVLLAEDGRIKIGDFGLARATSANTATGAQLLGTIAYLAPELVTRGTADARTDIYALGIMLYEILTGEQPYRGEQPMQIAYRHATEQVPRPSLKNPAVPEQLDELVLWATEREPDERPSDATEMLGRLREIEGEIGIAPMPVTRPKPATDSEGDFDAHPTGETALLPPDGATGATNILTQTGPIPRGGGLGDNAVKLQKRTQKRRTRGWWAVILTVVLAIVAGGTGWWFGSGPGSMVPVPAVAMGTPYDEADSLLAEAGLLAVRRDEPSLDVPSGGTVGLSPTAGERLDPGTTVTVIVSTGPAPVSLGSLRDLDLDGIAAVADQEMLTLRDDPERIFTDDPARGILMSARLFPAGSDEAIDCTDGCDGHQGDELEVTLSAGPLPDVRAESIEQARSLLEDAGLEVSDDTVLRFDDNIAAGRAVWLADRPADEADEPLRTGDAVQIVESMGTLPDVRNVSIAEARERLEEVQLEVADDTDRRYDEDIAAGLAIGLAGVGPDDVVRPGDSVTLIESLGPQPHPVPDVVGMNRDDAIATLEGAGFSVSYSPLLNGLPSGWVVVSSTDPDPGTELVPRDTTVQLRLNLSGSI